MASIVCRRQYLIPIKPGWYRLPDAAPAPTKPFTTFTPDNIDQPSGLVGPAGGGSRVGETSGTRAQIEAFVTDEAFGSENMVWHLNLLKFHEDGGEDTYMNYARAAGKRGGFLNQFGARSTLANDCWPGGSILGDHDFNRAIIAEYPCRDSYLSMGTDPEYIEASHFRHEALEETYIVSCTPQQLVGEGRESVRLAAE